MVFNSTTFKTLTVSTAFFLILGAMIYINYYPHYYAFLKTPKNYFYSGQASWFDPWDIDNYFATIKLAQRGKSILSYNINTTEPVKGALVYPVYTITGMLFSKVDGIFLYHTLAIISGITLALAIFALSYLLTKNPYYSLCAFLLTSLGGGFGILFPSVGADLSIPGVTFLSTFQKPNEAIAAILYFSSLVFFYLAINKRNKFYWLISILSLILLIPIYPYRLLSFFLIAGAFVLIAGIIKKKEYPYTYLGLFSVIVLPLVLAYVLHFFSSGYATLTNYKPASISLMSLLVGYGIFIVLCAYQLRFLKSKKSLLWYFLNTWVIVSLLLSILPFGMSRLYLSGLLFPMTLLFILSLRDLSTRLHIPIVFIIIIFSLVSLPSTFYIFSKRISEVKNNNIWYYIPESIKQGLDYLEGSKIDGVLALPPLSNLIPAYSVKHVYFGIKDQSPDYNNKIYKAILFYSGKLSENTAKSFLKENNINLVVISDQEREYGELSYSFLTSVYKNKSIEILDFTQ